MRTTSLRASTTRATCGSISRYGQRRTSLRETALFTCPQSKHTPEILKAASCYAKRALFQSFFPTTSALCCEAIAATTFSAVTHSISYEEYWCIQVFIPITRFNSHMLCSSPIRPQILCCGYKKAKRHLLFSALPGRKVCSHNSWRDIMLTWQASASRVPRAAPSRSPGRFGPPVDPGEACTSNRNYASRTHRLRDFALQAVLHAIEHFVETVEHFFSLPINQSQYKCSRT